MTSSTRLVATAARWAMTIALVAASAPLQGCRESLEAQTLEVVLDAKGNERSMRVVQEGHNVQSWRAHIDDVLVPFFGADSLP